VGGCPGDNGEDAGEWYRRLRPYGALAVVYDRLMEVDYNRWVEYIRGAWRRYGLKVDNVLDLGCGTGNVGLLLARAGLRVLGVDSSEEMLSVARTKADERALGSYLQFVHQDMRELNLGSARFDAAICTCDVINHLDTGLVRVFTRAGRYVRTGGLLIFDVNSYYRLSSVYNRLAFGRTFSDMAYIWESKYMCREKKCLIQLTVFISQDGVYKRYDEAHLQRAYTVEEIEQALESAGWELLDVNEAYTCSAPRADSERVSFIARRSPSRSAKTS